jgi:hypothetical protein
MKMGVSVSISLSASASVLSLCVYCFACFCLETAERGGGSREVTVKMVLVFEPFGAWVILHETLINY